MRSLLIWIGCILVAGGHNSAIALSGQDPTAGVIAQEKAWSDAVIHHDTARVASILSDDFVGIDGRGFITDKAAELKEAASPAPKSTAPQLVKEELSDIKVRIYGDTAVFTAINTASFFSKGKESQIQYRRTTVWVRDSKGWCCVSFHGSRILREQ
jgi:ketosteroid isomerase-like protein